MHRFFILLLVFASCTDTDSKNWRTVDLKAFKVDLPPHWKFIPQQGFDSYVGVFSDGQDSLFFDYGWYSPVVGEEDPLKHKLAIDTVNGLIASIVIPIVEGDGEIAMHITKFKDEQDRFFIGGSNLKTTTDILRLFKSITFPESDTTKNPILIAAKFNKQPYGSGKSLFQSNCAACHHKYKDLSGPALANVSKKYSFDWIYNYITNRKKLNSNNAYKTAIEWNEDLECTEFPTLRTKEVKLILDYIESQ